MNNLKTDGLKQFFQMNLVWIKGFVVVFYIVGLFGLIVPGLYPFFLTLFPYALLITLIVLVFFYKNKGVKLWLVFTIIYFVGFLVEAIGVNTGYVFGSYNYGKSLGFKVFETPLIIGINWLLLSHLTASILQNLSWTSFSKIFVGALLMLLFDVLLEQIAPKLDMWFWKDNSVPIQNYIAWFIIALLFQTLLNISKIDLKNKIATTITISLFSFFFLIMIYLNFLV